MFTPTTKKPSGWRAGKRTEQPGGLLPGRGALELRREFLHAAGGVDQALLAGEGGMRVHRHIARHDVVFHAVNLLLAGRLHGGTGEVTTAGTDIEVADVVESGMAFGFHGNRRLISPAAPCSAVRLC